MNKISRVAFPDKLSPLVVTKTAPKNWETKAVRATMRKFGVSYQVALGLLKDLQGPITLFSHRLAEVAFIMLYDKDVDKADLANLMVELHLTQFDLLGYTTEEISIYVHQFYADACEACMTEVLMDRRKHTPGAPDRFDKALEALMDLIAGRSKTLNPDDFLDGDGNHIHKGETTVNVSAINALMKLLMGETINRVLARYPITNALIGDLNDVKVVALARAINKSDMDEVLDIIMKRKLEGSVAIEPLKAKKKIKLAYEMVRGFGLQAWHDSPSEYMEEAIYRANCVNDDPRHGIYVAVKAGKIEVVFCHPSLPFMQVKGVPESNGVVLRAPMPDLRERVSTEDEVGGFYVHSNGVGRSFARHGLVCLNTNVVKQIQTGMLIKNALQPRHIQLVTVMDVLAGSVIEFLDTLNASVWSLTKDGGSVDAGWGKQKAREFRSHLMNVLGKYVRPIGEDHHDDGMIYDSVDMLPLQASLQVIEAMPELSMAIKEHMLRIIAGKTFVDPIRPGIKHEFSVGAAPKGGSFAHVTKTHKETGRTLVENVGQPGQHNRDRGQREASGLATAWPLLKTRHLIRTIWDGLMPQLMERCTDLVYAYIPELGAFTNGSGKNTDAIEITPDGLASTEYAPKHAKYGPMTPAVANAKAKELTGDPSATVETLELLGWEVQKVNRFQGFLDSVDIGKFVPGANQGKDMVDVYSQHIVLVDVNPMAAAKSRKLGWIGTKSVAAPIKQRRYILLGGRKVYIDVIASIETIEQKKLEGDVVMGQGALLGKTHFDGTETPEAIEDHLEELKESASPKNGSIVYRTANEGTDKEMSTKYVQFVIYNENGVPVLDVYGNLAYCIPALHRSFVMKENETLAYTQKENGMSMSPWSVNLFGGEFKLSTYRKTCIEMLAGIVSRGADLEDECL